jgi:PBP1b-binding outer membrane lipoprotein LpoB
MVLKCDFIKVLFSVGYKVDYERREKMKYILMIMIAGLGLTGCNNEPEPTEKVIATPKPPIVIETPEAKDNKKHQWAEDGIMSGVSKHRKNSDFLPK